MLLKTITATITCLAFLGATLAQSVTLDDLPECALPCMNESLKAVNCANNDLRCFCANPAVRQKTLDCVQDKCPIQDRGGSSGVLADLCSQLATSTLSSSVPSSTSASSSSSAASTSRASSQSTTNSASSAGSSTTPANTATTTPTVTRITPPGPITLSPTSPTQSGTVVVIQTVNLPDPSATDFSAASPLSVMGGLTGTIMSVGLCVLAGAGLLVL